MILGRLKIAGKRYDDGFRWYCKWRQSETVQHYLITVSYLRANSGLRSITWKWWFTLPLCGDQASVHPLEYW